ncbi:MAG: respiratory nitrate reductase subunit gamma, partial [Planctomycetota bacterium]
MAVLVLVLISWVGAGVTGLRPVFGMWIPYVAILTFLVGFVFRIVRWARAPAQYRIPTTAGQQTSLTWIKGAKLESPPNGFWTFWRMALEVLFFRSLFRNTKAELRGGPRLVYGGDKWLWAFALMFHWSFLIVFVRHLRFFTEPVPFVVSGIESLDRFFEIGVPALYATDVLLLLSLGYLLLRRFANAQVKYISLASDYFPLFLLLGIGISGV